MRIATLAILATLAVTIGINDANARDRDSKIRIRPVPDPYNRPVRVEVWTDRREGSTYCAGDSIRIFFRTNIDAYVTIYDLNTQGRVNVLFPNRYHRDNFVRGGRTYSLPSGYGYRLMVEGPRGWEYLRAVATTNRSWHYRHGRRPPVWRRNWSHRKGLAPESLDREIRSKIVEIPDYDVSVDVDETSIFVEGWRQCRGGGWDDRRYPPYEPNEVYPWKK